MSSPGTRDRERFMLNMQKIEIGATLMRHTRPWIVVRQKKRETGIEITLRHGRREFSVHVPVCHTGPVLWEVGLKAVTAAPTNRELFAA